MRSLIYIFKDACLLLFLKWNEDRRAHLRAELDAFFAKLYGLTEEELRHILAPRMSSAPTFQEKPSGFWRKKKLGSLVSIERKA